MNTTTILQRLIVLALLTGLTSLTLFPQSLSVYNINVSGFPTIKADYLALDAAGEPITNLDVSNFRLQETPAGGGGTVNLTPTLKHGCRDLTEDPQASIILVLDRSGSMLLNQRDGLNRWKYVEKAVENFVGRVRFIGETRVAVVAFASNYEVFNGWTDNPKEIMDTLKKRFPAGHTDYDAPFNEKNKPNVFDLFAQRPANLPKFVFFLTDGEPTTPELNSDAASLNWGNRIGSQLSAIGARFFAVSFMVPNTHLSLSTLATRTGGKSLLINNEDQLVEIFGLLALETRINKICTLEWQSPYVCTDEARLRNALFTLVYNNRNYEARTTYETPLNSIGKANVSTPILFCGDPAANTASTATLTVTATNGPLQVNSITITPAGNFDISDYDTPNNRPAFAPFTLQQGQSRTLTVRFTQGPIRTYREAFLRIDALPCNQQVKLVGGAGQVQLISPIGGELFSSCDSVTISWAGVLPTDGVTVEFSSDGGTSWNLIRNDARGLFLRWLPPAPGTQYKIRVTRSSNSAYVWRAKLGGTGKDSSNAIAVTPTGDKVFVTGWYNGPFTYGNTNVANNQGNEDGFFAEFDANGNPTRVALLQGNGNNPERMVGVHTDNNGVAYVAGNYTSQSVSFTPYGTLNLGPIDDASNGFVIAIENGAPKWQVELKGTATRRGQVEILDFGINTQTQRLVVIGRYVRYFRAGINGATPVDAQIINSPNWQFFVATYNFNGVPLSVANSAVINRPGGYQYLRTSVSLNNFTYETGVFNAPRAFDPLDPLAHSGQGDVYVSMFGSAPGSSSESTTNFSVQAPSIAFDPTTFTVPPVAQGQTSVPQTGTIRNTGNFPVRIVDARFQGANAADFKLITASIIGHNLQRGQANPIEFDFTPTGLGPRTATLVVTGACNTVATLEVNSEGLAPCVWETVSPINLGKVVKDRSVNRTNVCVLRNNGPSALTGSIVSTGSPDIVITRAGGGAIDGPFSVPPGACLNVDITFTATSNGIAQKQLNYNLPEECGVATGIIVGEGVEPIVTLSSHPFGDVRLGCGESASLELRNSTSEPVEITAIALDPANSPHFTATVPATPFTIQPDQAISIPVTFSPQARGPHTMTIRATVVGITAPIEASITGRGTQPTIAANDFAFAPWTVNQTSGEIGVVNIRNDDPVAPLTITGIRFDPPSTEFQFTSALPAMPVTIMPGGAPIRLEMSFTPAAGGTRTARIVVDHDAKACPIPPTASLNIAVTGIGAEPSTIPPVDFGDVLSCAEAMRTVTIVNPNPSSPLVISAVNGTGDVVNFPFVPIPPFTIDPGGSRVVSVTFRPSAARQFVTRYAFDNNQGLDIVLNLSGNGITNDITFALGPSGVFTVGQNAPKPVNVTVPNLGPIVIPQISVTITYDPVKLRFNSYGPVQAPGWVFTHQEANGSLVITGDNPNNQPLASGTFVTPVFDIFLNADERIPMTITGTTSLQCLVPLGGNGSIEMKEVCYSEGRLINLGRAMFQLNPPRPNPSRDVATLAYSTGIETQTTFTLVNAMGSVVRHIVTPSLPSGEYELTLNVDDLGSGVYSLQMVSGPFSASVPVVITR
jgi:hypothetical protein